MATKISVEVQIVYTFINSTGQIGTASQSATGTGSGNKSDATRLANVNKKNLVSNILTDPFLNKNALLEAIFIVTKTLGNKTTETTEPLITGDFTQKLQKIIAYNLASALLNSGIQTVLSNIAQKIEIDNNSVERLITSLKGIITAPELSKIILVLMKNSDYNEMVKLYIINAGGIISFANDLSTIPSIPIEQAPELTGSPKNSSILLNFPLLTFICFMVANK